MNIYPYVYRGTHPTTGEFYIGMRYANKVPAKQDLSHYYKTSSETIQPRFHEFEWDILAEFFTKEAAYDFEQELIHENFKSTLCLNKSCMYGGSRFMHDDFTGEKIKKRLTGRKQSPEHTANILAAKRAGAQDGAKYKPRSEAHKRALSVALKGRVAPNKGYRKNSVKT